MEDLLRMQIRDSCRLALPEGLKDLMCDISREVLRAQPNNLYNFIADYLSALLVTRENLHVADQFCSEFCENICYLGLEEELRKIGLTKEHTTKAMKVINKFFTQEEVKESHLLVEMLKDEYIEPEKIPEVQEAVRSAFRRYQTYNTTVYESSSDSEASEVTRAVHHTIRLYRHTKPSEEDYNRAATRIQAAYRAYSVRRAKKASVKSEKARPLFLNCPSKEDVCSISISSGHEEMAMGEQEVDKAKSKVSTPNLNEKRRTLTASSISLAGSYLQLPKYKPYSVHDTAALNDVEEALESTHNIIDYTTEKSVSFDMPHIIEDIAVAAEIDTDESFDEDIEESIVEELNDEEEDKGEENTEEDETGEKKKVSFDDENGDGVDAADVLHFNSENKSEASTMHTKDDA